MPWTILLFASGSLAIPAPSIFLVPPYPSSQDDPIYISCTAPEDFLGANFTLYRGREVVQLLQAPSDRPGVTFNVTGGGGGDGAKAAGGNFHCQYGVMGEHSQPQMSDLSQPVQISFPVPTWILALSLSLAGAVLLLAGLVAVAVVVRKAKVRNLQKQRERESCWAQINVTNTDLSFDNSLFAISTKMTQEDLVATLDAHPSNSGPRRDPPLHHPLRSPRVQHFPGLPVRLKNEGPFVQLQPAAAPRCRSRTPVQRLRSSRGGSQARDGMAQGRRLLVL